MKNDMNDLKKLVLQIMDKGKVSKEVESDNAGIIRKLYESVDDVEADSGEMIQRERQNINKREDPDIQDTEEIIEESLSLEDKEIELITKALEKHNGKRKYAAQDLGISERTLYRKIKEYNIE
jgi:transcriptional regulator with PAS, ATPase and Fis domain